VTSLLIGAVIGTVTTLLWNAILHPRIVGRSLAELLAADISLRLQAVLAEQLQAGENPRTIPQRNPVPTVVFRAVVGRVAELPREIVGDVVLTYQIFERLNETSARTNDLVERFRLFGDVQSPERSVLDKEIALSLSNYHRLLQAAGVRMNNLQPKLIAAARPWWSIRWQGAPAAQTLKGEGLASKMADLRNARDAAADAIRLDP
jgi:hypothetical protein